jgi:hypothetical protein
MELRAGPGGGLDGFVLPEVEIVPTAEEVLAAVGAILVGRCRLTLSNPH